MNLIALLAVTAVGHFAQANPDSRVSLDIPFKADLRRSRGVEFDFRISDVWQCANFSFYYKSKNGWYATSFEPEVSGQWVRIRVGRERLTVEGSPAGTHWRQRSCKWLSSERMSCYEERNSKGKAGCGKSARPV